MISVYHAYRNVTERQKHLRIWKMWQSAVHSKHSLKQWIDLGLLCFTLIPWMEQTPISCLWKVKTILHVVTARQRNIRIKLQSRQSGSLPRFSSSKGTKQTHRMT
jgi:hypothetical protein